MLEETDVDKRTPGLHTGKLVARTGLQRKVLLVYRDNETLKAGQIEEGTCWIDRDNLGPQLKRTEMARALTHGEIETILQRPVTLQAASVTKDKVRNEAQRRMMQRLMARSPQHLMVRISNNSRETIRLVLKGRDNWTQIQADRFEKLKQEDVDIEAIRHASNILENSTPEDYTNDKHWP